MNKPSKCKNCQWYGKPYWSIINPCDNCNKEDVEIFTHWIDPTIQEKDKEIERLNNIINEFENDLKRYDLEYLHETGEHQLADVIEDMLDKLKELKENNK